jgi:hypothetical protein
MKFTISACGFIKISAEKKSHGTYRYKKKYCSKRERERIVALIHYNIDNERMGVNIFSINIVCMAQMKFEEDCSR